MKQMTGNLNYLSNEELIKLTSGSDFWNSESLPEKDFKSFRMSDGPNGLRFQETEGDHLGVNDSLPSTSFPTASATASSWNVDLIVEMGKAIGKEAASLGVDIVLGPGVNIKRNPLGGRNFEYFSEDPFLAGKIGAAWINGIQSMGIGASLKHYAANNQEYERLVSDSIIDHQALHELYLEAFRIAVTESHPETIMCSYNKINGVYASENRYLLTDVLRNQWGFGGAVITDWGALNDKVASIAAGTDLEMPSSNHLFDEQAVDALNDGNLKIKDAQRAVSKIKQIVDHPRPNIDGDIESLLQNNSKLAQKIAEESAVLLKNDEDILPLNVNDKILLVGEMAEHTRFQGAGSSHINAFEVSSILDGFMQEDEVQFEFQRGYSFDGDDNFDAAINSGKSADRIVFVAGLPETTESEGFDRENMKLPQNQLDLLEKLAVVNPNVVVLLVAGAPVELPFLSKIKGLLNLYLNGQQVGLATIKLLFGEVSPSGKLAETYPILYRDVPSAENFHQFSRHAPYFESLYVGYRFYEKAKVPVAFPFGFGLSYSKFKLSDFALNQTKITDDTGVEVVVRVTNTGKMDASEVVQIYVGDIDSENKLRPIKELKSFQKVFLMAGESQRITLRIPTQGFKHWNETEQEWQLETGSAKVLIGTSSQVIDFEQVVEIAGVPSQLVNLPQWYLNPTKNYATLKEFESLMRKTIDFQYRTGVGLYNYLSTPAEMGQHSLIVRMIANQMTKIMTKGIDDKNGAEAIFMRTIILDTPIIRLAQQSTGKLSLPTVNRLIDLANHRYVSAIKGGDRE